MLANKATARTRLPFDSTYRHRTPRPLRRPIRTKVSSTQSLIHCRVEFTELDAGVLGGELPIGRGGGGVAPMLPSLDVALQRRPITHPLWQVAAEGAQLDLGHVQPGAVLGVWWISSRSATRLASS